MFPTWAARTPVVLVVPSGTSCTSGEPGLSETVEATEPDATGDGAPDVEPDRSTPVTVGVHVVETFVIDDTYAIALDDGRQDGLLRRIDDEFARLRDDELRDRLLADHFALRSGSRVGSE